MFKAAFILFILITMCGGGYGIDLRDHYAFIAAGEAMQLYIGSGYMYPADNFFFNYPQIGFFYLWIDRFNEDDGYCRQGRIPILLRLCTAL
jgi:hypothetical protein